MTADAPHEAELIFEYSSVEQAQIVGASVGQEVGKIEGDRTHATVEQEGECVVVRVTADDLVGLRAGLNTWMSLLEIAERSIAVGTKF